MKDKRTYTKLKEHGEDMSHENESTITNEDRGALDLTFLIEQHKQEIWEFKQKHKALKRIDMYNELMHDEKENVIKQGDMPGLLAEFEKHAKEK